MTALGDQLRALLPPEAYSVNASKLAAVLEAEAAALAGAILTTDQVTSVILPDGGNGLADWERVLRLPDPCLVGVSQSTGQRVKAAVSKWKGYAGQSAPFFIAMAKALGYDITITVFRPARAGIAQAGDPLNGGDWNWTWRVNAPEVTVTPAVAGVAGAGDPLASWGNKALECRLSQLKPAESILLFGYGAS